jgi:hypothetical protein
MTEAMQALQSFPRTITLPSGITAVQTRPLKGRDAVTAHRIAADGTEIEKGAALVAQVVKIDEKPVVMEDLLELELTDLGELMEAVAGKSPASTPKG